MARHRGTRKSGLVRINQCFDIWRVLLKSSITLRVTNNSNKIVVVIAAF